MPVDALAAGLISVREHYRNSGDMTVHTHLFFIRYAHELEQLTSDDQYVVLAKAGVSASMHIEMQKCIKLARYVEVRPNAES